MLGWPFLLLLSLWLPFEVLGGTLVIVEIQANVLPEPKWGRSNHSRKTTKIGFWKACWGSNPKILAWHGSTYTTELSSIPKVIRYDYSNSIVYNVFMITAIYTKLFILNLKPVLWPSGSRSALNSRSKVRFALGSYVRFNNCNSVARHQENSSETGRSCDSLLLQAELTGWVIRDVLCVWSMTHLWQDKMLK